MHNETLSKMHSWLRNTSDLPDVIDLEAVYQASQSEYSNLISDFQAIDCLMRLAKSIKTDYEQRTIDDHVVTALAIYNSRRTGKTGPKAFLEDYDWSFTELAFRFENKQRQDQKDRERIRDIYLEMPFLRLIFEYIEQQLPIGKFSLSTKEQYFLDANDFARMKSIKDATHFISRECFSVIGLMRAFALYRINNTLCEKYSCDGTHFAKLSHSETLIRYELIELAAQNVTVFYSAYKCNRKSRMAEGKVVKLHFPPRRLNKGGDWPNFIHSDVLAESLSSLIDNKMPPKSIYPIRFERDGLQLEHHSLCLLVGESLFMIAGGNCEKGSSLYRDQLKHLDQLEVPAAISKKSVPAIVGMKYGYLPSYPVNSNTTCDTITVDISDPNCYKAKLLSSEKYDLLTGQSFENWIQTLSEL